MMLVCACHFRIVGGPSGKAAGLSHAIQQPMSENTQTSRFSKARRMSSSPTLVFLSRNSFSYRRVEVVASFSVNQRDLPILRGSHRNAKTAKAHGY